MSYVTLNRFWHQFASVVESVFKELAQLIACLGILGDTHAVDSTSISKPFLDNSVAAWIYDSTKGEFYYGYGLLLVVDVQTQLPIAAPFVKRKQAPKEEWIAVIHHGMLTKKQGCCLLILVWTSLRCRSNSSMIHSLDYLLYSKKH